jgi:hypothetical protein
MLEAQALPTQYFAAAPTSKSQVLATLLSGYCKDLRPQKAAPLCMPCHAVYALSMSVLKQKWLKKRMDSA